MTKPKKAADSGRSPMDEALRFLGARARTAREVERRLEACEFGEAEIETTLLRLQELRLVDDAAFAVEFVRTRLAAKPVSRAHLRAQLLQHETAEEAIASALAGIDEEQETGSAGEVARKYARQYAHLPEDEREELVLRRLIARGYTYDDARAALHRALDAEGEEEA